MICKDLQIIKKKQTAFWSAFIRVVTLKIFKWYCNALGTWSSPSTTYYKHLKKQASNFTSIVALNFPRVNVICYYLIFHVSNFLSDLLIKQMIRSSHLQLCRKSSCSLKLEDGLFDHNSRRIPAQDLTFNIFINFPI